MKHQLTTCMIGYVSCCNCSYALASGNTHKLVHWNWGERLIGRAIGLLHAAFVKVQEEPKLILDYKFMMTILEPHHEQLPEFSDYMDYYEEEKEGHVISSMKISDCV